MKINFSMWRQALNTIPRISKEDWDSLDIISRWLIATRAAVFIMTAMAAMIGGLLAFRDDVFQFWNFFLALSGLVLAHATNNMLNDYIDFKKGIDKDNYYRSQYGPQPLEHGFLSVGQLFRYILTTFALALAAGIALYLRTGPVTLWLLLAGVFFLVFYTWPLKYIGLGEPTVILVWGPLMIGGTYMVTNGGDWSWTVAVFSLVYALGPTTVLFGKHIDKSKEDKAKKVYTLPVILGEKLSRYTTIGFWVAQFLIVIFLVIRQDISPAMLIVFLAIPKFIQAIKVFRKARPTEEPSDLPPNIWPLYLSANAFVYNKRFGLLFLAGLILDIILVRTGVFPF